MKSWSVQAVPEIVGIVGNELTASVFISPEWWEEGL